MKAPQNPQRIGQLSPRSSRLGLLKIVPLLIPFSAFGAEGILKVSSSVDGAQVFIDNKEVGVTPYLTYVEEGAYLIRVSANNYDPYVRKVTVSPSATTDVDAKLKTGNGSVEFYTSLSNARVLIDEKELGPIPLRIRDMTEGEHSFKIVADGYEPEVGNFTFEKGFNLFYNIELRSSKGLFVVTTNPSGASVYFDGWEQGVTPLELENMPPAKHHVRVHLDGYADLYRVVDTSDGSKGEIVASLVEKGAGLVVKTGNPEATVSLNGSPVGTGSKVAVDAVERGTIELQVSAPNSDAAEIMLQVPISGKVKIKANLQPEGGRSSLAQLPPLYERWSFWVATGVTVGGGAAVAGVLSSVLGPEPPPEGDIPVVLP